MKNRSVLDTKTKILNFIKSKKQYFAFVTFLLLVSFIFFINNKSSKESTINSVSINFQTVGKFQWNSMFVYSNFPVFNIKEDEIIRTASKDNALSFESSSEMNLLEIERFLDENGFFSLEQRYYKSSNRQSNYIVVSILVEKSNGEKFSISFDKEIASEDYKNNDKETRVLKNTYGNLLQLLEERNYNKLFTNTILLRVIPMSKDQIPVTEVPILNVSTDSDGKIIDDKDATYQKLLQEGSTFRNNKGEYFLVAYVPVIEGLTSNLEVE